MHLFTDYMTIIVIKLVVIFFCCCEDIANLLTGFFLIWAYQIWNHDVDQHRHYTDTTNLTHLHNAFHHWCILGDSYWYT